MPAHRSHALRGVSVLATEYEDSCMRERLVDHFRFAAIRSCNFVQVPEHAHLRLILRTRLTAIGS